MFSSGRFSVSFGALRLLLAMLGLLSFGWSNAQGGAGYILKIDSQQVPYQDFEYLYNKNYQGDSKSEQESPQEYLERFINFKLKVHEAYQRGYDTTQQFLQEFETYRSQLSQPYLTDAQVLDRLVKEAYERYQYEVRASHILISLPSSPTPADTLKAYRQIDELRERANAGEDFNALAMQYSQDPSAKSNRGNLGYFTALQMVYPFESAAFSTPVGKVSTPLRTRFGYHIIKVHDKRPSNGAVRVAHIMVKLGQGATEAAQQAAMKRIEEAHEKLKTGGDWDALCAEYSEDRATKDKGGVMNWFTAGTMVFPFAEAAFQLESPGDISGPVRTPFGWHIIKLLERKPVGTFAALERELTEKVKRDGRAQKAVDAFLKKAKNRYGFREHPKNSQVALSIFNESLTKGKWQIPENASIRDEELFLIGGHSVTIGEFFQYVIKKQSVKSNLSLSEYAEKLYRDFQRSEITAYVEKMLPEQYPEYAQLVKEYREGLLLFQIMEEEVWNKASTDSAGLAQFFSKHRTDYQWEKRVKATILESPEKQILDSVAAILQAGSYPLPQDPGFTIDYAPKGNQWGEANTEQLLKYVDRLKKDPDLLLYVALSHDRKERKVAEELKKGRGSKIEALLKSRGIEAGQWKMVDAGQIRREKGSDFGGKASFRLHSQNFEAWGNAAQGYQVRQGKFEVGDHPALTEEMFVVGSHEALVQGQYVWVRVTEVLPATPKTLQEVKGLMISKYQDELEKRWVAQLRERYHIEVNTSLLERQ